MRKRIMQFSLVFITSFLFGCINSTSPTDENVSMEAGDALLFQVEVFPASASIQWHLDGEPIPGETGTAYEYAPESEDVGLHELTVSESSGFGTDSFTWNVQVSDVWAMVSGGGYHSLAIKTDGTLWAWGYNSFGQLGDDTTVDKDTPTQIGTDTDWAMVSAGEYYSLAIKTDGSLWAWGWNNCGQLGNGTWDISRSTPAWIGHDTDWAMVSGGGGHTLAIKTDGSLWAWGVNTSGQLGVGETTEITNIPIRIGAATSWTSVAAGYQHSLAIKPPPPLIKGSLWAWGDNYWGQLGDGTTDDRYIPVLIGSDSGWATVATGGNHSLAIKTDGSLWAWGCNYYGQLGDGSTLHKDAPVQIWSSTAWALVSGGYGHTLAIKSDGTLWAWGYNGYGQIGNGTTDDRDTPARIGSATDWAMIATGNNHSLAIKTNGTLWVWGYNSNGQLGDGTTENKNTPTRIYSD